VANLLVLLKVMEKETIRRHIITGAFQNSEDLYMYSTNISSAVALPLPFL
jgi:hypothetical protein